MALPPDLHRLVELAAPVDVVSTLMAECGAALVSFDELLRVTWVDARATEQLHALGATADDVVGRRLVDLPLDATPGGRELAQRWHHRLIAVTATRARAEHVDVDGLGDGRGGLRVTLVPRVDAYGAVIAVVAIVRPLEAMPSPEPAVGSRSSAELADRLGALGHIAAGVTHEVSNPLTTIYGNLELARQELAQLALAHAELADDVLSIAELLDEARSGAERIRRVIADIGLLGHGEGGPSHVDLREIVRAVLRLMGSDLEKSAVLAYEAEEAPFVAGPPARVGLLVSELVLAAMGSLPDRPTTTNTVGISVSRAGGDAVLTIADNGVGADLGPRLGILRHLVASLGGRLELDSTVGAGTLARVTLPGVPEPAAP